MLKLSGCPFCFKGGSALMLILGESDRWLSIDIDIQYIFSTFPYPPQGESPRDRSMWGRCNYKSLIMSCLQFFSNVYIFSPLTIDSHYYDISRNVASKFNVIHLIALTKMKVEWKG